MAQSADPTLQAMAPNGATAGSGALSVTLTGSGYTNSSIVIVQGQRLEPTSISATALTVIIPADFFLHAVPLNVYVADSVTNRGSEVRYFYVYSTSAPTVTAMIPAGGLRGMTTSITLSGSDLTGATFSFSGTGVSAVPGRVTVEVTVAADAPLGVQNVTISTPSGSTAVCGGKPCTFTLQESGSWSELLPQPTIGGTPVRLLDGRILVAGGSVFTAGVGSSAVSTAHIFNPDTGQWTATGSMNVARAGAVLSLLPDGRVLAAGGGDFSTGLRSAEIYDPATGRWSLTGSTAASAFGKALLLPDGKVLVQVGHFAAEAFDPASGRFLAVPQMTFQTGSVGTQMELLADGRVLIVGRGGEIRIYNPRTATLSALSTTGQHDAATYTRLLPDGRVLLRGVTVGPAPTVVTPNSVIYNPKTNTTVPAAIGTSGPDVLLPNGMLLIGNTISRRVGFDFSTVPVAFLYDPAIDESLPQAAPASMVLPTVLLQDGRALGIGEAYGGQRAGYFTQIYTPVSFVNPKPVIGSVIDSGSVLPSEPMSLDIHGTSFLPNSIVLLGATRLVTLYLGREHLVAFVPPSLRSSLSAGISVHNPAPGGGLTDAVRVGFTATAPLPIDDIESGPIRSGYVIVTPDAGTQAPISTLTYGMVRDGVVQSQAAILPGPLTTETAVVVDVVQGIGRNLGLAVANASGTSASVTFTLRDRNGATASSAVSLSIPPRNQIARFVTEIFPSGGIGAALSGSVTIQSSIPVSVVGLRFSGMEFSTVPVPATGSPGVPQQGSVGGPNALMFPQFAMSGGWATTLSLVNSSSTTISGRVDFFDTAGNPLAVTLNGERRSTFTYVLAARGSLILAPRDVNGQSPF